MNSISKKELMPIVPLKYAGKWIAWDYNHTRIVASGRTVTEAHRNAVKKGEGRVWLDKAPDAETRFGGAAFKA